MVEATNYIDTQIFCEHVQRCGILLVKDHSLYSSIYMHWYCLFQCWYQLQCNSCTRSLQWIYIGFYDIHVNRRLSILHRRNEGKLNRESRIQVISNPETTQHSFEPLFLFYVTGFLQGEAEWILWCWRVHFIEPLLFFPVLGSNVFIQLSYNLLYGEISTRIFSFCVYLP